MKELDLDDPQLKQARHIRELDNRLYTQGAAKKTRAKTTAPDKLKLYRKQAGLTQKEVADFCRVSVQAVKAWESGRSVPAERHMDALTWIRVQVRREAPPPALNVSPIPGEIKALRGRAKMTQAQLADMLDVSTPTVARWESGVRSPSPEHLQELETLKAYFPEVQP